MRRRRRPARNRSRRRQRDLLQLPRRSSARIDQSIRAENFSGFNRGPKLKIFFCTMTAYEQDLPVHVAFPKPPKMKNILGEYLSNKNLRQFRCAETEKYPHVTFFF